MERRNRSTGWIHAKISGHINEEEIKNLLENDKEYQEAFLHRVSKEGTRITTIRCGGIRQKKVNSILPGPYLTTSKTDLYVTFEDESMLNISIKKSLGGQVYLIGVDNFIRGFELHFGKEIPEDVQRGMRLFWGTAGDIQSIIDTIHSPNYTYENRKKRIVACSLEIYNSQLVSDLLSWFDEYNYEIFEYCFSRGNAKEQNEWADILWNVNKVGENLIDDMFFINELQTGLKSKAFFGTRNGGTTIHLDFGFVQWHQGKMQFHQNHWKIIDLLTSR